MEALKFIVEMTKALAWPLASVVIFLNYRKPIIALIERLSGLKYGDFEATFATTKAEVAEQVSEISKLGTTTAVPDEKLFDLADRSPRAAVLESWLKVERALNALWEQFRPHSPVEPFSKLVVQLSHQNVIDEQIVQSLAGLRALRNIAVHGEHELTSEKAKEFVALAGAVEFALMSRMPK